MEVKIGIQSVPRELVVETDTAADEIESQLASALSGDGHSLFALAMSKGGKILVPADKIAYVEFGGPESEKPNRLAAARRLSYNDLSADRQTVAAVQAMEAILARHAVGTPNCLVEIDHPLGGLVLLPPGKADAEVLYAGRVNEKLA